MSAPTAERPIPATIHERCGMLDDPARAQPCPCRRAAMARTAAWLDAQREAARRVVRR